MPKKKFTVRSVGKKPKNERNWLKDQDHRKIYDSRRWRNFRKMFIQKNPVCKEKDCTQAAVFADHIIPISEGGPVYDEDNIQGLCPSCNGRKTRLQR